MVNPENDDGQTHVEGLGDLQIVYGKIAAINIYININININTIYY